MVFSPVKTVATKAVKTLLPKRLAAGGGKEIMEHIAKKQSPKMVKRATGFTDGMISAIDNSIISPEDAAKAYKFDNVETIMSASNEGMDAARRNQLNNMVQPAPIKTNVDNLKETIEVASNDQKRGLWNKILSGFGEEGEKNIHKGIPGGYADKGRHFMGKGQRMITAIHHAVGLDDMMSAIKSHKSWGLWHDGQNPIVQRIRESGFDFGNHQRNLTDAMDTLGNAFKQAEVDEAFDQIEGLGGWVHKDTLNDIRGGSKLDPKDLSKTERADFESKVNQGIIDNIEDYMDNFKSPDTGRDFGEGTFPNIKVKNEAGEVLEEIKINTAKDHKRRYQLTFEAYERHGIGGDMQNVRKKFKVGKRKISTDADIISPDHKTIHNIIDNELKTDPNTAFGQLEILKNNPDQMDMLDEDQLANLIIRAAKESEAVTFNVNMNRYKRLLEVWKKYQGDLSFEAQDALTQQAWFHQNVAEIARKGGVVGNTLTKEQALVPVTEVPQGFRNIFGWEPQGAEIEAIAKELGETVQPTMPGT